MHLTKIFLAVLPALALAQDPIPGNAPAATAAPAPPAAPAADATTDAGYSTITQTATTKVTKTLTLSRVHTFTSVLNTTSAWNTTSVAKPTVGTTSIWTSPAVTTAAQPSKVPDNAGSALDATRVALAGALGVVVVMLL